MQENNYNIGIRNDVGEKYASGIAYVVIPSDIDREVYVRECYKTSTVSIYSEHNGFNNRIHIDRNSLNFVTFPLKVNEFGSPVSFAVEPIHNIPVITGIFFNTDELSELEEHQFRFKRKLDSNFIELVGSAKGKYLGLNVSADQRGEVFINVRSKDMSGRLNLHVDGDAKIDAVGNLKVTQHNKYSCVTVDKNDPTKFSTHEQTSTEESFDNEVHSIHTEKLNINNGEEPFILGKKWAKFMKDFIEEVGKSTVSTTQGQMPLLNKIQIDDYIKKVDELLSEIAFIDK